MAAAAMMLALVCPVAPDPAALGPVDFRRDVLPLLKARCGGCHGPEKASGGLRLDSAGALLKGGESGPAARPGDGHGSVIVKRMTAADPDQRMPPEGPPLSATEAAAVKAWIDQGAHRPAGEAAAVPSGGKPEPAWSWRPIRRPPTPDISHMSDLSPAERLWVRTPIDAFVLERLRANGLRPAPEADRRTLARRLWFDLTGLPPLPEELDAFLADRSPAAYERLADRLLASPRHGERWARHWLDVAHYADSHGQEHDRPRPHAWPYRDWVINAFNADLPFADFVRHQVAGDVLRPGDPQALVATGFLAAGPFDESSLVAIREDTIDRLIAQYLDRDDIVTNCMTAFTGLTVHCARCHDHKFDAVTQEDYYALQAVFAATDKADRRFDDDPKLTARRERLEAALAKPAPTAADTAAATRLAADLLVSERKFTSPAPTAWSARQGAKLRALLDGSLLSVGPRPDKDTYAVTYLLPSGQVTGLRLELLPDDSLPHNGPGRQDNGNVHVTEVRVTARPAGGGAAIPVRLVRAAADGNEPNYGPERALDGNPATGWSIYPGVGQPHRGLFAFAAPVTFPGGTQLTVEIGQEFGQGHLIGRFRVAFATHPLTTADDPAEPAVAAAAGNPLALATLLAERRLKAELAALPPPRMVYCGTNRFPANGSFRPAGKPRPIHVLKRGEASQPGSLAAPGAVASAPGLPGRFRLANPDDEGQRRAALADWLAHPDNPFTWRAIVNRVWQHHFGAGLAATPNDLGRMGSPPSHPELLDWLADEFRRRGGSLKALHRLIVTSSAYRQQSRHDAKAAGIDAANRLLWRANRRRLDAESVRDAVLLVSGRLDERRGGPADKHFVDAAGVNVTGAPDYGRLDLDSPAARRRTVYRFAFRTHDDPLLLALDGPDTSRSVAVRTPSLGAPQALALWNNRFMLHHAEHLARLASAGRPAGDLAGAVAASARRVLLRDPQLAEAAEWTDFAARNGLPALCRVLLNSNEFQFTD